MRLSTSEAVAPAFAVTVGTSSTLLTNGGSRWVEVSNDATNGGVVWLRSGAPAVVGQGPSISQGQTWKLPGSAAVYGIADTDGTAVSGAAL